MKKLILAILLLVATPLFAGGPTGTPVYTVSPTTELFVVGSTTVTTAGTATALGTSTAIREVLMQAKRTNTGRIYVGDSTITNDDTKGVYLDAGDTLKMYVNDMTVVYLNANTSGEGITYLAW